MVFNLALASKFSNVGGLEEMRYSALKWYAPYAGEYLKAWRKGGIL
ncbi:MAG: hypothetical protein LBF74_03555 [Treponema sp.]|jgi:hypothetical protein|nr:hypothetical protein [Treponema sp.]